MVKILPRLDISAQLPFLMILHGPLHGRPAHPPDTMRQGSYNCITWMDNGFAKFYSACCSRTFSDPGTGEGVITTTATCDQEVERRSIQHKERSQHHNFIIYYHNEGTSCYDFLHLTHQHHKNPLHFYISVHLIMGGTAISATSTCHEVACVR